MANPYVVHLVPLLLLALPASPSPSFFGLNGSKHFHNLVDGRLGQSLPRFAWMKELGVRWDRIDLWWHIVEPIHGTWDFSKSDAAFAEFERQGVQWFPILCYGARWFEDGRNAPRDQQDFPAFAEYVRRVVTRYRGRAPVWALWNEPNVLPFWAPEPKVEDYVRLMKLAYPALKKADPNALLAAPVIAPIGPWDRGFTEQMYRLGGNQFDVFDYHYYRSGPPEREVPTELGEIRAVMRRFDREKPIWISESGVTSADKSEALQARLIVRHHLIALASGAQKFFYFDLQNWQDDKPQQWDTQLGLVKADGTKKLSFDAYKTMVRRVDGREIVGRCAGWGAGVERVLLRDRRTGQSTLAVWSNDGRAREIDLWVRPTFWEVGLRGTAAERRAASGIAKVRIDGSPKYVVNVDPHAYLALAGVRFDQAHVILTAGESTPLRVEIPRGLDASDLAIQPSAHGSGPRWSRDRLKVPAATPPGRYPIRATATWRDPAGRTTSHTLQTVVEVVSPLAIEYRPYMRGDALVHSVFVQNGSRRTLHGTLSLGGVPAQGRMTVGAMQNVEVSGLAPARFLSGPFPGQGWRARFEGSGVVAESRPLKTYPLVRGRRITVDGDLGEWLDVPPLFLRDRAQVVLGAEGWTPAEASAEVRVVLGDEKLYFMAIVRDEDPLVNDEPGLTIWKGDSFELFVGFEGPARRRTIDKSIEFQIGLAPVHLGLNPIAFWFHRDVPLNDAGVIAERRPDGWQIEAVIELEELGLTCAQVERREVLGFDVKLNDLDRGDWAPIGVKAGRELVWSGDATNWINPSRWGVAIPQGRQ